MLTLILMRHAKSDWGTAGLADHERPLNDRGTRSARAMGRWLKSRSYLPDEMLCSSARRTVETLEGLHIDAPARFTQALYHADPGEMLGVLRTAAAPSVLMLGHNPGIADFAEKLLAKPPAHPRFEDYPTCATLVIRFDGPAWADVDWRRGEAVEFAIPREIMAEDGTAPSQ